MECGLDFFPYSFPESLNASIASNLGVPLDETPEESW